MDLMIIKKAVDIKNQRHLRTDSETLFKLDKF